MATMTKEARRVEAKRVDVAVDRGCRGDGAILSVGPVFDWLERLRMEDRLVIKRCAARRVGMTLWVEASRLRFRR